MEKDCGQRGFLRPAWKTGHLDIAEPIVGKPRVPVFYAFAFQNVSVGLENLVGAEFKNVHGDVFLVYISVRGQQFRVFYGNLCARRTADVEPDVSGHVLPEVEDINARLWLADFDCFKFTVGPDRRHHLRS